MGEIRHGGIARLSRKVYRSLRSNFSRRRSLREHSLPGDPRGSPSAEPAWRPPVARLFPWSPPVVVQRSRDPRPVAGDRTATLRGSTDSNLAARRTPLANQGGFASIEPRAAGRIITLTADVRD